MHTVTASEAIGPMRITSGGKAVLVAMSNDDFEVIEAFKTRYLKEKLAKAQDDADSGRIVDGAQFFDDILAGKYD